MTRNEKLEILSYAPEQARPGMPPLLFLHGAYTAAWCWQEHFLPFFAAAGFECHALSLSGHGGSRRRDHLDSYSIDDYVNDVAEAIATLAEPPILIGHSMGGFVVQKYLENHAAPAAVLMCSVPPQGLAASAFGMLFNRPGMLADLNRMMSGQQVALDSLREALFAQPVSVDDLTRYYRMAQPESHRAIWDMTLFNLPHTKRVLASLPGGSSRLLIQGAAHDMIIPASLVEMTARSYGVDATTYQGMGHALMLEADWKKPAQDIIDWLEQQVGQ
ncbi:MAG: alpha/beta hydrolase [Gammaproteobacteria bacterium]|nr:alpha/beta hydrolase [Rhodocyclaceae bacterium]MBU3908170.1 alpha/beta hydrolase [Gammaproteobacteria bacterium]MBU3989765.1 alpha/beta hydrolase [Gammaproteobacteria bacterium]MBU4005877.1 alpha/beta hydrolase [Gammaproteobacteria bacterium]MBU4021441.1 alpha/beta hydrolase [Gammaproteobacteria bacterium]